MAEKRNIILVTGGKPCSPSILCLILMVRPANVGIGYEVVRQLLAQRSNHIFLGSRSIEKGEKAVKELQSLKLPGTVELLQIDVGSFDSVTAAAAKVEE